MVPCHPDTTVGDYVPFYFCPRSVMLYVIHMANHPELDYRGGQAEIVHLEADLHDVVRWAEGAGVRWAFSLSNAGAYYTQFRTGFERLRELDWGAIAATDFRAESVKEGKQAEFLVHGKLPWRLVRRIGVQNGRIQGRVTALLGGSANPPAVEILPAWYY